MSDGVGERQKGSRKARHALTPRQVGCLETAETEQELESLFEELRVLLEVAGKESIYGVPNTLTALAAGVGGSILDRERFHIFTDENEQAGENKTTCRR
jgi:hypothetical protein